MTANELREELETELAWRQEELAFFKNQLNNISDENDQRRYRKSLVLILYSHMEGYIKKIDLHRRIALVEVDFMNQKTVIHLGIEMVGKKE